MLRLDRKFDTSQFEILLLLFGFFKMTTGIYAIENNETGDRYVGQSVNIERRWSEHRKDLNAGRSYSRPLQEAWNYFGSENFSFKILEICSAVDLDERENFHMMSGSSLNHTTGYVVPLPVEDLLEIDPNSFDGVTEDKHQVAPISSAAELVARLEELVILANKAEALAESIDEYFISTELLDDRLLEHLWEKTRDAPSAMVGSAIEVIRMVSDQR